MSSASAAAARGLDPGTVGSWGFGMGLASCNSTMGFWVLGSSAYGEVLRVQYLAQGPEG